MKNAKLIANSLSFSRLLMVAPACYGIVSEQWLLVTVLLVLAVITDFADGYIARRFDCISPNGGLLDHSSDAVFVSCGLATFAWLGQIPLLLPILVILSFIQYVLDSKALQGKMLRSSVLGRNNGVFYFVLLFAAVVSQSLLEVMDLSAFVLVFSYVLIASTVVSMVDRLWTLLQIGRTHE